MLGYSYLAGSREEREGSVLGLQPQYQLNRAIVMLNKYLCSVRLLEHPNEGETRIGKVIEKSNTHVLQYYLMEII